ncbi:hypothetical protein GCM10009588_32000 [Microbacterium phyllosphaerae]
MHIQQKGHNMTDTDANPRPAPLTRHDLRTITPEEIVAAYEQGNLAHLTVQGKARQLGPTNQEKS